MEEMTEAKRGGSAGWVDGVLSLALAAVAFVFYRLMMADYVFPGESAHLMALWNGLDVAPYADYPLMGAFARRLGAGNMFAVVCGAVACGALYRFLVRFFGLRVGDEARERRGLSAARFGALAATLVFLFTPAVEFAATHLEPNLFEVAWALVALVLLTSYATLPRSVAWAALVAAGGMVGCGAVDTPLFILGLPLYFLAAWTLSKNRGGRGYGPAAALLLVAFTAFFVFEAVAIGDMMAWGRTFVAAVKGYFTGAYLAVLILATVPFVVSLFSGANAFRAQPGWTTWLFHIAMTFATILGVSALSPSVVMRPVGAVPVATSAFVAMTAGYLAVYWFLQFVTEARRNESLGENRLVRLARPLSLVVGGIFAVAVVFTVALNVFSFDRASGAFADRVAEKIIDDLGPRTWFVTDGTLDDHLRFAARERGKELHLLCLQRENDKEYLAELSKAVKEGNIGSSAAANANLRASLSLGILPFVQDWMAADPEAAARTIAVFSAPDLWYSAKGDKVALRPVPEFLFFGADQARFPSAAEWEKDWAAFDTVLAVPERRESAKAWGSYQLEREKSPTDRLRLMLRRHVGMVANNRGVWLQDAKDPQAAFAMYETVMEKIDADNVCALFNELELAGAKLKEAVQKANELERRINAIVADKTRRYILWRLGNVYGYIRNPQIFIKLGYAWARSGRPGEALEQVRRAIDFIPTDRRSSVMNMMAALYASESEEHKSREIYERVLAEDADNHDALIGLMRLELLDGESAKAMEYLKRATAAAGDDPRANVEIALLHLMKNELAEAKGVLRKATDADHANLQAWSLLAAVTLQQIDAAKDKAEALKLTDELEHQILPTMEKQSRSPSDYYVQTVRAFILMRQGEAQRRAARDAFVAAAKDRPDIEATGDIILGIDISLNDTIDAERQARDVLRRNRKAPLANYVMGSLALGKGEYAEAETFLRRSADAPRPVVLAMNDLAEVLRRTGRLDEALHYAEMATAREPKLYVAWETLGAVLLARHEDLDRAEECVNKAVEMSKDKDGKPADVRMLVTLARIQLARGDKMRGKGTLRKVSSRLGELSDYEREEFEELRKSAR